MRKIKAAGLSFKIERPDNKYADQYVDIIVFPDKSSPAVKLVALIFNNTPSDSDKGLFMYGLYGYLPEVKNDKCEVIGIDFI
jgi:hypothetical protein